LAAYDAGEHHPAMVSAAKARASRTALEITRAALQMHGAIGYTEEHDIGLYYKRALTLAARYGGELGHTGRVSALTLQTAASSAALAQPKPPCCAPSTGAASPHSRSTGRRRATVTARPCSMPCSTR